VTLDDLLKVIGDEIAFLGRVIAREELQERESRR
jgi:hypothetical protein